MKFINHFVTNTRNSTSLSTFEREMNETAARVSITCRRHAAKHPVTKHTPESCESLQRWHSRINSTRDPNFRPRYSQWAYADVTSRRSARSRVRVDQRASAVRAVEMPTFVCNHVTGGKTRLTFLRLQLNLVMQNAGNFMNNPATTIPFMWLVTTYISVVSSRLIASSSLGPGIIRLSVWMDAWQQNNALIFVLLSCICIFRKWRHRPD